MTKKQTQPSPRKRPKILIIALTAVLVIALGIGIGFWLAGDPSSNPADWLDSNTTAEYNTAATEYAWRIGMIASDEILLQETIEKKAGGDTTVTFRVYKLPAGAKATDYLGLTVADVEKDSPLSHMGNASCRFLGDRLSSVYGLNVKYIR